MPGPLNLSKPVPPRCLTSLHLHLPTYSKTWTDSEPFHRTSPEETPSPSSLPSTPTMVSGAPVGDNDPALTLPHSTVVITLAVRSPLCKAGKGGYKDMSASSGLKFGACGALTSRSSRF